VIERATFMSGGGKKDRPIRDRRSRRRGRVSGNSPSRNSLSVEDSRRFVDENPVSATGEPRREATFSIRLSSVDTYCSAAMKRRLT